jgi:hypothetical protein
MAEKPLLGGQLIAIKAKETGVLRGNESKMDAAGAHPGCA